MEKFKKKKKGLQKSARTGTRNILFYSFIFRATAFSSIVRMGITLTPITLTIKCVAGASRIRMQSKSLRPHTVDSSGIWVS